jgi:hypothetical protein
LIYRQKIKYIILTKTKTMTSAHPNNFLIKLSVIESCTKDGLVLNFYSKSEEAFFDGSDSLEAFISNDLVKAKTLKKNPVKVELLEEASSDLEGYTKLRRYKLDLASSVAGSFYENIGYIACNFSGEHMKIPIIFDITGTESRFRILGPSLLVHGESYKQPNLELSV